MLTAAQLGAHCIVATPKGFAPKLDIIHKAIEIAESTGGSLTLMNDPIKAVTGVDAVYTDVCTSMGFEHEATKRAPIFKPYQVNEGLMANAQPHAVFMHCLPAHRNAEVTDAVLDGPQSVVFDQAENRMHAQKALLLMLLGGAKRISNSRARGSPGPQTRYGVELPCATQNACHSERSEEPPYWLLPLLLPLPLFLSFPKGTCVCLSTRVSPESPRSASKCPSILIASPFDLQAHNVEKSCKCPIIEAKTYHFSLTTTCPRFTSNGPRSTTQKAPGETLGIPRSHNITPLDHHDYGHCTKVPQNIPLY